MIKKDTNFNILGELLLKEKALHAQLANGIFYNSCHQNTLLMQKKVKTKP